MKIALCLSGQARSYEKGYEYHKKNLLDHYDVDVFYYTWRPLDRDDRRNLADLYFPRNCMVEPPLQHDLSKYTRHPTAIPGWKVKDPKLSTYAQLYAIQWANVLKKRWEDHAGIYDWVIRSRFDFALNVKIPFEDLDNTKLYIPNCRRTPGRDFGNDQFAFSSSENMNKYSNLFNILDMFYDQGVQLLCEDLMSANWKYHNLVGENLVYVDVNHPFPPGEFNGTWHSLIRDDFVKWNT